MKTTTNRIVYSTDTQTARQRARKRANLARMHRVAQSSGKTEALLRVCNCVGCRIQRCEIEGNTATPCTGEVMDESSTEMECI